MVDDEVDGLDEQPASTLAPPAPSMTRPRWQPLWTGMTAGSIRYPMSQSSPISPLPTVDLRRP